MPKETFNTHNHKEERGQTIILVAIAMLSLLAMAALAIDVVTLYVARSEAQRVANGAVIAGAKMFTTSGFTSVQSSGTPPVTTADACTAATAQAQAAVQQNTVAGQVATATVTCDFAIPLNPKITVVVNRTGLPIFFARIWGRTSNSVTATATAEAYNPSGQNAPIKVSVKPWLLPNCDPSGGNTACPGPPYFVNPTDGTIPATAQYIGQAFVFDKASRTQPPRLNNAGINSQYYALNVPVIPAPVCPSAGAVSCDRVGTSDYLDNIACAGQYQVACGQQIVVPNPADEVSVDNANNLRNPSMEGLQCLVHANGAGLGQGQDVITPPAANGQPITITGGDNNPNTVLQGVRNISRSDSIVTVPLYDAQSVNPSRAISLCPGGACTQTATVVGFVQLAIQQVNPSTGGPGGITGSFNAVIVNASGCNPNPVGNAVSGGGVSPVPVRLIGP